MLINNNNHHNNNASNSRIILVLFEDEVFVWYRISVCVDCCKCLWRVRTLLLQHKILMIVWTDFLTVCEVVVTRGRNFTIRRALSRRLVQGQIHATGSGRRAVGICLPRSARWQLVVMARVLRWLRCHISSWGGNVVVNPRIHRTRRRSSSFTFISGERGLVISMIHFRWISDTSWVRTCRLSELGREGREGGWWSRLSVPGLGHLCL